MQDKISDSPYTRRGISHLDAIDLRRAPLSGDFDITDVYIDMVSDLKTRGY